MAVQEQPVASSTHAQVASQRPQQDGRSRRQKIRQWSSHILIYVLLIGLGTLFLAPIGWMLSTALKTLGEVSSFPPSFFPHQALWSNFVTAVTAIPFGHNIVNTIEYVVIALIGDLLSSSFIAYGFAHIRFRHREIVFLFVLATMMVPYEVLLIPQFILFKNLGWINTYLPLIVPTFFGSPYLIFLLRQSFRSIPREIIDAARLDGASHPRVWWSFVLPLSKPALAAVAIFSFMYHWNDFVGPLVYLNSNDLYPISVGLSQYTAAYGGTVWNLLMAASLVAVIPCVVVFLFTQRLLVENILIGGGSKKGGATD